MDNLCISVLKFFKYKTKNIRENFINSNKK